MNLLETATLKLKAISPVHIKGKDIEYGQGFVRRDEQTAYAIDSDRLAEYFYNYTNDLSLVTTYVDEIEDFAKRNKLKDYNFESFLSKAGIYHHVKNRARESALITQGVFKAIVNATPENKFIRDGLGQPIIPGSSIKGVLRTAVMYHMASEYLSHSGSNLVKSFIQDISSELSRFEEKTKGKSAFQLNLQKRHFSKGLQEFIFQNGQTGFKANEDFFRCVKVKDSGSLSGLTNQKVVVVSLKEPKEKLDSTPQPETDSSERVGTIIQEGEGVYVDYQGQRLDFTNKVYQEKLALLKKNSGRRIRIIDSGGNKIKEFEILEGAPVVSTQSATQAEKKSYPIDYKLNDANQKVDFDIEAYSGEAEIPISLDKFMLNEFNKRNYKIPFSDVNGLFELVKKFSEDLWHFETAFFEHCTDEKLDVSRVSQFYENKNVESKVRLGWAAGLSGMTIDLLLNDADRQELRDRLFVARKGFPAPKSRRLIVENEELTLPLGWMQVVITGQ